LTIVDSRLPRAELGIDWFALAPAPPPDVPHELIKLANNAATSAALNAARLPFLANDLGPRSRREPGVVIFALKKRYLLPKTRIKRVSFIPIESCSNRVYSATDSS
jgi:hypothetical protein